MDQPTTGGADPTAAWTVRVDASTYDAQAAHGTPPLHPHPPPQSFQQDEQQLYALKLKKVLQLSIVIWLGFFILDWLTAEFILSADIRYFLALRLIGTAALLAGWVRLSGPSPPRWVVAAIDLATSTLISVLISLMCVLFGGFASSYSAGISLVLVARGALVHEHWRQGWWKFGVPAVAHPATLFAVAFGSDDLWRQLAHPGAIAMFVHNCIFIFATWAYVVYSGHAVWSLRRSYHESKNIGRYRLKRHLGAGGMGDVWVAYDTTLKREVALKLLHPWRADEGSVRRFRQEFDATARLIHPNTVRIFDYGVTDDGLWYYAMELLPGQTLNQLVARDGPLPADRAARLCVQVCHALAEAHAKGIVHRDLKPENVMVLSVGGQELAKLLDFGIAKLVREAAEPTLTATGWVGGTPAYISPEVAAGKPADPRSDVYSLGATLYFAVTRHPPFDAANAAALLHAHITQDPVPPSERVGHPIDGGLVRVVLRCLTKDPGRRYQTALELAADLEAVGKGG
jgi:serine/threonine-protein kinase